VTPMKENKPSEPTADSGEPTWRMCPFFVLRHAGMPFEWLEALGFAASLVAAADEQAKSEDESGAGLESFVRAYEAERALLRRRLHATAARPEVSEALFLSNPGAFEQMFSGYLARQEILDTSRFRRVERQVYTYLQRFCGKNETASTFGPMGYGVVDDGIGLRIRRRPGRPRRTLMSRWALERLARAVARDPGLRNDIPIRRNPQATEHGDVIVAGDSECRLEELSQRAWASLASGQQSLTSFANAFGCEPQAVAAALRPLRAAGAVVRGLRFPSETTDGLAELRHALGELPPSPARTRWEKLLSAFADDLASFERSALGPRRLLLAAIEARFEEASGTPARRGAGEMYADRLVLFEEAMSPFDLMIGKDLARWIESSVSATLDVAAAAGARLTGTYRRKSSELLDAAGGSMPFPVYAARSRPEGLPRPVSDASGMSLDAEWCEGSLVVPRLGPHPLDCPVRFALPDLCLAGASPEIVTRQPVVVARVHHHLLLRGWLTTFATAPERFDEQALAWVRMAGRRVVALGVSRRNKGFYRFPGPRLVVTADDNENRPGSVAAAACTVAVHDGEPCLVGPDGTPLLLYLPLADLVTYQPLAALASPALLQVPARVPGGSAGPVFAGGAVYQRRRWHVDFSPTIGATGPHAFIWMRRLVSAHGLPRFVFVRTQHERKPYLVDLASPFALDLLRHILRESPECTVEEMAPGPDELWLRDERGRYTAELRVQFLRGVRTDFLQTGTGILT
jgi:Lantibiotic dehydratase, N terminus